MKTNEETVYHYTSLDSLFSILSNRSFWLMDLRSSMDKNDIVYGEKLVKELGKEHLEIDPLLYGQNYYALSCTKDKDSYFHFNNYGDSCKGVSIGINRGFIEKINDKDAWSLGYYLSFEDIIYDREAQKQYLQQKYFRENAILADNTRFRDAFQSAMPLFKREEFYLEQEIRFVYKQDIQGGKTLQTFNYNGKDFKTDGFLSDVLKLDVPMTDTSGKESNLKWKSNRERIRKYYDFSFEPFGTDNVIKSITLGPLCEQSEDVLREFCKAKGFNPQIFKSKIELR